ncbi:helix-turn-helix domain-containing protein [Clostridium sp. MD294]|uniref:helix-turn-helix domain-containing protein n=1 Tax=Clostridium sp. MD294 TaxID=97138 RepID=UPI0002CCC106|nr:helix-turn-helix domain-containing protein [Clostridium sp. MD294]NDO47019.1 helix-turn-helix transcriptional regulator [Clostridium sp. MD294]USF31221.1 hypothetical protein C820_002667 [Clostridium sp. MD294]
MCNCLNTRLKAIRKSVLLSQEEFGKKLGITGAAISKIESGNRNVTEQMTLAIIREFDVNEQWLRTGEGEMFLIKTRDEEIASFIGTLLKKDDDTFKKRLISALSKLEEPDWEVLEKMCNFMLESKKD